jgi:hypothetical protein
VKAKLELPTDAQEQRRRLCQVDNQRSIEADVAHRILESDGPLEEWERDLLVQLHQECKSWQTGTRSKIDNRLSRGTDIRELRRLEGVS